MDYFKHTGYISKDAGLEVNSRFNEDLNFDKRSSVSKNHSKNKQSFDTASRAKSVNSKQRIIEKISKMSEEELIKLVGNQIELNPED